MQNLGQVATDSDTEYYSFGESIWCLLLMIKLWLKICQSMIPYTLQYTTSPPFYTKNFYIITVT